VKQLIVKLCCANDVSKPLSLQISELDQRWEETACENLLLQLKTYKTTLASFVERNWGIKPAMLLKQGVRIPFSEAPYCDGALRLQHNRDASISDVAVRDREGYGFFVETVA
jgi:hypothetical protein